MSNFRYVSPCFSFKRGGFNRLSFSAFVFFIFVFFIIFGFVTNQDAKADAWSAHLKPSLIDGFDKTGFGVIALGGLAVAIAQPQDYGNREQWSQYQKMSSGTARIGDYLGQGVFAASVILTQVIFDSDNAITHAEALATTFVATSILKTTNKRHRPNSENPQSMPSGHTSFVFATATSLTYSYGWVAAVPSYLVGVFVAASRWSDDAHWLSDTVAGAAVGIFWGRSASLHHTNILPVVYSDGGGLLWTAQF